MSGQSGRPRSGNERLNVDRILEAALGIVDREGIDALSMRRLGRELGVDPMAVYHHLPNKQAIIHGLVERVFQEIHLAMSSAQNGSWQQRTRQWAHIYRRVAHRHQPLIIHLIGNAEAAGRYVMLVNEVLYQALEPSGLRAREVVLAADLIVDYIHGVILGEQAGETTTPDWQQTFIDRIEQAPVGELPSMQRIYRQLDPGESRLSFAHGLDVIIAGLEQRISADG
jgi:TetR/AcrR family transcriptional regulator, tetracycline repressor protein